MELPPLPPLEINVPLGRDTLAAWRETFGELNKGLVDPLTAEVIDEIFASLQKPLRQRFTAAREQLDYLASYGESRAFYAFWKRTELSVVHLLRFCVLAGIFDHQRDQMRPDVDLWLTQCLDSFHETHPNVGLREVAGGFRAVGLDPTILGRAQLSRDRANPFPWPADQVWPYWAEQLDVLEQYLQPDPDNWDSTSWKRNALEVLALFPQPPARFVPALWELALGTAKADRLGAQRCLAKVPDKLERLLAALASGKAETRTVAADWLRSMREPATVEPLLVAVRKEKHDVAKSAMMSALEQLGVPVEQFLDRSALLAEASKGLAKGIPASLALFPFELLPPVHWADSGKRLDPEVIRWWLAQQCKLKNPEPGPLLRRYCASLRAADREALGQFVVDAWIIDDTAAISRADAEQAARLHAQMMLTSALWAVQHAQKHPNAHPTPPPAPKTLEEYYATALPVCLQRPRGSAIESKGILAVAAACGGSALAPIVQRYLKQWYGMRPAQCRALLQMLAWVEHPSATQVLLATGSRFRTKGIQEEAHKQTHALAERKGWTLDELSDRTIPSAGLDEDGVLTLDFGPRRFTARLNKELELTLFDTNGKAMKALPDPREADDEALAAAAKKLLGSAKKELKTVLSMQRDRLYEAMCVERRWRLEDWELYLNRHPILRHYTQRLVWAVFRDGEPALFFRPLPDGSLTDTNHEPVRIGADESVGLAHERHAAADVSQAWSEHLRDYAVEPLFEQFGKPTFTPSDEQKCETELRAFEGHLVEAFKLRGRATKLGYTRGQAQDGGWFYQYARRFPSLGIEAVIEFMGNSLPEENRTVALQSLKFQRLPLQGEPASQGAPRRVKLAEVPPVLLSECWNALRQVAAEGPGFDPDWEKKTAM